MAIIVEIQRVGEKLVDIKTYHLKDADLRVDESDPEAHWLDEIGDLDERFEAVVTAETVRKLLEAAPLTPVEREILTLTFWRDLEDKEIAATFKRSPSWVRQQRETALSKLRQLARRWGLLS